MGDEQRKLLRNLPLHIKLELLFGDKIVKLLLEHGSATSIDELLNEDYLFDMMQKADADIMCFGHTHQPYHKTLKRKGTDIIVEKYAINIGSIGKPKDRDPRGCYLIFKLNEPEYKAVLVCKSW
ncbi:metallophosphoesterase family protein [Mucilaginibacter paludis]|uniref:metallophosphoesterase family protein n=1 Tax=Mucilaginibacter paludis TaxID=423351 RepID=UPI0001E9D8D1|nr:metallophosphoesterase family protein [Mucilaginibacter paludis]